METSEYWDALITYGIATEEELQLVTDICGYSEQTLDSVLYCREGNRDWEQYCYENDLLEEFGFSTDEEEDEEEDY